MGATPEFMRNSDLLALHASFFAHLDMKKLENILETYDLAVSPKSLAPNMTHLGTGSFCHAYRVRLSVVKHSEDYVISVPHKLMSSGTEHIRKLRRWHQSLKSLEAHIREQNTIEQPIPLIPPILRLKTRNTFASLSLYAPDALSHLAPHWQNLDLMKTELARHLRRLNLDLHDGLQMRSLRGIPLVHDFSDLCLKS